MGVAHIALDLRTWNKSRNGVDDYNIDSARTGQSFGYLERLLAVVRLRDEKRIDINAEIRGIHGIERVLGIDKRSLAAHSLSLGDNMERESGFTGRLWAVYLDYSAARKSADAGGGVEGNGAGRDSLDIHCRVLAKPHYRAFAEILLYLRYRSFKRFLFICHTVPSFRGAEILFVQMFCSYSTSYPCKMQGYFENYFDLARKAMFMAWSPTRSKSVMVLR